MPGSAVAEREGAQGDEWSDVRPLARWHYGAFLTVYALYGYQVCPFLETLSLATLLAPAAVWLALHAVFSGWRRRRLRDVPLERRIAALFWGDLGFFAVGGGVIAIGNLALFSFPPDSGIKVVLCFAMLGFYASMDFAFEREMRLARSLRAEGRALSVGETFLPFKTKFVLFTMINIAIVGVVSVMVVLKDLIWAAETTLDSKTVQLLIMIELVFIIAVLGGYTYRTVSQYSRKMNRSIAEENAALQQVFAGDLDASVTVASNDEFGRMAHLTNHMIARLKASNEEMRLTRDVTITMLVGLAGKRDKETGNHLVRTQHFVVILARALRDAGLHQERLTDAYIDLLFQSAPLHDIGKVGVPDAILLKPGRLSEDEFAVMKTHAMIGAEALADADMILGGSSFLATAREIAESHHEKWDGSGYPFGLKGAEIPLSGRLMAVADVYDALRSRRVYKPGMSHAKAAQIIVEGAGSHFDPDVVEAFLRVSDVIESTFAAHEDDQGTAPDALAPTSATA